MPTNVYFNHAVQTEQHLYEDLVVESLRFYGHDVLYLPRTIVEEDSILNDDVQSTFGDAYSVEMYLENVEGFEGEGDLVSKFGVQIQEEATFILSLRTWERFISLDSNLATSLRPNEGDLIYFPLTGSMFEINFVEDQDPFFQMSKMFVFKMRCSLFSYGGEDFDTGTAADLVEADSAYTIELTMNTGSGNYIHGENLTTVIDGATVTVGEVVLWQPQSRKLTIKDNTRTLQVGDILTGATSSNVRTIGAITDVLSFGQDHSAQNIEFEQQDSSYLDFSEVNPFGEP
tara:strand:- start:246 stop:1106 length:861 start_codon:yes stop_codon:yes gene_type:complete